MGERNNTKDRGFLLFRKKLGFGLWGLIYRTYNYQLL